MVNKKLLAKFKVMFNEKMYTFSIYGDYELKSFEGCDICYKYPEFNELSVFRIIDGKEVLFIYEDESQECTICRNETMMEDFIASLIEGSPVYTKEYLEDGLQQLVDFYVSDDKIVTTVDGLKIPGFIIGNCLFDLYELTLVTDRYIFYTYHDDVVKLRTRDHMVFRNAFYRNFDYMDSVENIRLGKETLIWGELPEEKETGELL